MNAIVKGVATVAGAVALAQPVELRIRQRLPFSGQGELSHLIAGDLDAALDTFTAEVFGKNLVHLAPGEPRFAQGGSQAGIERSQAFDAQLENVRRGLAH